MTVSSLSPRACLFGRLHRFNTSFGFSQRSSAGQRQLASTQCSNAAAKCRYLSYSVPLLGADDAELVDMAMSASLPVLATDLPQSPLADESWAGKQHRWKQPKPAQSPYIKTRFQRHLERNAFAQLLATPGRICSATRAHLPRAFLQGFRLMAHPETGEPWLLPVNLVEPGLQLQSAPEEASTAQPNATTQRNPKITRSARGPSAYVLARGHLIHELSATSGKYRKAYRAFMRDSEKSGAAALSARAVWRDDMEAHVLELMRRRIVQSLLHLADLCVSQGRRYLVPYESLQDITGLHQLGCVLVVGHNTNSEPSDSPKPHSSLPVRDTVFNSHISAHALEFLLGSDHLKSLQTKTSLFRDTSFILLRGQRTLSLQVDLWKLQGYLHN